MNNDTTEPNQPNTNQQNQNLKPYPQPSIPSVPSPESVPQNPNIDTANHSTNTSATNTHPQYIPTQPAQQTQSSSLNSSQTATPNPIQPADQPAQTPEQNPLNQNLNHKEKHHSSNNKKDYEYNSNPFIVAGKGLGAALSENPSSSILIAILPVIIIFPAIFIVTILGTVLSLFGGAIGALFAGLIGLVLVIALALLLIRIAAGSINILLMSVDREKISTKSALGSVSSSRLTSFVGVYFLTSLAVFFGFLLFIIPGVYLLARFSLAPVIVYAEDMKAMAAIKRSMTLTKGHVFEMLGAITAQSMLSGNGLLSTIGASSGIVKRYKELTDAEKSGITDTGKVHWLNFVIPVLFAIFLVGYIAISIFTGAIEQNNTNNFNNFNNDSFINDDFRFEDFNSSDFNNSDLDSFNSDITNTLQEGTRLGE